MNIHKNLEFKTTKPSVLSILKTDKINYMAIGLLEDQLLKKHKANIPTILTVLKGSIEFSINNEHFKLNVLDTFKIPVSVEHEVKGLQKENVFTLMQER